MTNLTDLDVRDLEPMFQDPTVGLSKQQRVWWEGFCSGSPVQQAPYEQLSSYRAVVDLFRASTGNGGSPAREAFLAWQRAGQKFMRTCAEQNPNQYRASQGTVDGAVLKVLDADGEVTPRAVLVAAGVPVAEVARIAGKTGAIRKFKKALQKHVQHPSAQRMIQTEGKREYMRTAADTLSGSLEGIAMNMKTHALLAELKANAVEQARQIAELQAWKAAVEIRHAVDDSGVDPRSEALRLHADGLGYKAIAGRIGRSQSTVRNWVKAV